MPEAREGLESSSIRGVSVGEFCAPPSKNVLKRAAILGAPRYRYNSVENAGAASKRVIRIVAR